MHPAAVMLITHDMGVIAETANRLAVMYAGRLAEIGPVRDVIKSPHHPYTQGLMGSIPRLNIESGRLVQISAAMPRLDAIRPAARSSLAAASGRIARTARPCAEMKRPPPRAALPIARTRPADRGFEFRPH